MKNKTTLLYGWVSLIIIIAAFAAGCGNSTTSFIDKEVNPNINVLGVKLDMAEAKANELAGGHGEKAMCIYGYEYEYNDKHINIGFKSDKGTVRRITTKNADTTIYGIKPGTELNDAYSKINANGFTGDNTTKYKFYKDNIFLSIISMKGTNADGITIEIKPE